MAGSWQCHWPLTVSKVAVKAGQADLVYTSATYADQAPAGYSLLSCESVDNRGINLPAAPAGDGVGNDLTADVLVRRAINLGVDQRCAAPSAWPSTGSR